MMRGYGIQEILVNVIERIYDRSMVTSTDNNGEAVELWAECVNPVIVAQPTTFRRRFNLKKADWEGFSADFDSNIEEVDAIPENYERFVEMLRMASRKHIPIGCRSNYIPGFTDESKSLYEAYKKQYSIEPFGETTIDTSNTLIDKMKDEKKKSWEEVIASTDLTHNSRRAWHTIRKLFNDPTTPNPPCLVNANQVAHQLLINDQGTMPTKPKLSRKVRQQWRILSVKKSTKKV